MFEVPKSDPVNTFKLIDLKVGQIDSVVFSPTKKMVDDFAHLSGDWSPIHVDSEFAKNLGLPDVIVHGIFTASAISRLVGMRLPGAHAKLLQINLSWPKPVYINDSVVVTGEIIEISESTQTLTLKITGINQNNQKVLKGTVLVGVGL